MKQWKRIFSLQLVLCLLLALLPVTASAAMKISSVAIQIQAPVAGQKLDTAPTGGNDNQYNVGQEGQVLWYDETVDGDHPVTSATAGHSYRVEIAVYAKSENNYAFDVNNLPAATVNGEGASVDREKSGTGRIYVVAYFNVPAAAKVIDHVYFISINKPQGGYRLDYAGDLGVYAGQSSATTPSLGGCNVEDATGSGIFTNGVAWYDVTDPSADPVLMASDAICEVGHIYELRAALKITNDNVFADTEAVTVRINGKLATAHAWGTPGKSMMISYTFDVAQASNAAASFAITELDTPQHGKKADYTAALEGTGFAFSGTNNTWVQNGISWFDVTGNYSMTANDTFIGGHTYTVTIDLVPKTGFVFRDGVTGTLNGEAVTPTGGSQQLQITKTFTLAVNKVTNIAIEGITAPATGKYPSYVAIVRGEGYALADKNDYYYKNGIGWCYLEGSSLPVTGYSFEPEQIFEVYIYLTPEEGYTFDTQNLKATVNGNAAHDIYANANQVILVYRYPTPTAPVVVSEVVIEDVVMPVAGAKPTYTATINDGRYELNVYRDDTFTKNGITWYKDNNALRGSAVFEEGVSYSVVVAVTAMDGYSFKTNTPGTINGMPAEIIAWDEYNVYYQLDLPATEQPTVSAEATSVGANTVTIVVTGNTGGQPADLYIAIYDADGRMIGLEKAEGQNPTGGDSEHSVTFDGLADLVSVFLLNESGVPYSGAASVDLK